MNQNPRDTIAKISKEYGYEVRTFWTLIAPFKELKTELDTYLKGYTSKAKKTLPPILIDKIFSTLGEP